MGKLITNRKELLIMKIIFNKIRIKKMIEKQKEKTNFIREITILHGKEHNLLLYEEIHFPIKGNRKFIMQVIKEYFLLLSEARRKDVSKFENEVFKLIRRRYNNGITC